MIDVEKQLFLQQMLSKGTIMIDDAITLMNKIITELNRASNDLPCDKIDMRYMKSMAKELNQVIKPEEIQFTFTTCEVTGTKQLTLHSIGHNTITELQSYYSPQELAYWLPVMEEIIKSNTKSMNKIGCLNLVKKYQLEISLDDAENFLKKFTDQAYLIFDNGLYYLGSKAICEFHKDLRRIYEDYVQICELCSELVCHGKMCMNCNKLMHLYCLQAAVGTNKECALCHVQWKNFEQEQSRNSTSQIEDNDIDNATEVELEHENIAETDTYSQSARITRNSYRSQRKRKR